MARDPAPPSRRRLSYQTLPPERRPRAALTLATVLLVCVVGWLTWALPLSATETSIDQPSVLFVTADGRPLSRQNYTKAAPVSAEALPDHVVGAVLAIEDRRFWRHPGVDLRGIGRAALTNARHGRVVAGGSTITQQLAKNAFLGPERSLRRKAQEAVIAVWLELRLGKAEILSRYLSNVYFGEGVYGLRAAARHYYGKEPERLALGEAAVLAGMIKAPSALNPRTNPEEARARARQVLAAMVQTGVVSAEAARKASFPKPKPRTRAPVGSYFVDWIQDEAEGVPRVRRGQLTVRTTLDGRLQSAAERIVRDRLAGDGARLRADQAALVALRCDGAVVTMVGGRDYRASQFNRATQAKRQPGSAFKLFVYLAALRQGAGPGDLVTDAPVAVGDWEPGNYESRYGGDMTVTRAFAQSSNSVAVQLSERVGRENVIRAARDLGVESPLNGDPSIALGSAEVDLLELSAAYAAVRAGRAVRPYGIEGGARDGWGERLNAVSEQEPLLDMLHAVVERGSGRAARFGRTAYGKTGTTQDYRDALFVGFAGDLTVGVWVGNDDRSPMRGVKGGGLPALIWRDFMQGAERAGLLEAGSCAPLPPPGEPPPEPQPLPPAASYAPTQVHGYPPLPDPAFGFEVLGPEAFAPPAHLETGSEELASSPAAPPIVLGPQAEPIVSITSPERAHTEATDEPAEADEEGRIVDPGRPDVRPPPETPP